MSMETPLSEQEENRTDAESIAKPPWRERKERGTLRILRALRPRCFWYPPRINCTTRAASSAIFSQWARKSGTALGGGRDGTLPPTDSADRCYMDHDRCYEHCPNRRLCDAQLLRCLDRLPWDPRSWPEPPRPGTEVDSALFLNFARIMFGQLASGLPVIW